jgi:hypothetical protein
MTERDKGTPKAAPERSAAGRERQAARKARLAARLRDNLGRRKAQRRGRTGDGAPEDDKDGG